MTIPEVLRVGGVALLQLRPRWESWIEHDPEVPGTDWVHPAYAIAAAACVSCGISIDDPQLNAAFKFLDGLWSPRSTSWIEPGGRATIRADFHTVRAFNAAQEQIQGASPALIAVAPTGVRLVRSHG